MTQATTSWSWVPDPECARFTVEAQAGNGARYANPIETDETDGPSNLELY